MPFGSCEMRFSPPNRSQVFAPATAFSVGLIRHVNGTHTGDSPPDPERKQVDKRVIHDLYLAILCQR